MVRVFLLRRLQALALPFWLAAAVPFSGQAPSTKPTASAGPAFLVADVHPSSYSFAQKYFRWYLPDGSTRFTVRQGTLQDMIRLAYGVRDDAVLNGPTWLDFDRFEVTAKVPPSTNAETAKLMLRNLLADRFKLVVKTDMRALPAMLLQQQEKVEPKLKRAADSSVRAECQFQPPATPPKPEDGPPASFSFSCRNMTMEQYAHWLTDMGEAFEHQTVVDSSGLKGAWDFDITYERDTAPGMFRLKVAEAVEKQLGLKLQAGTAPQPVLTIVSVSETPTPNVPNLAELLPPPPPPEFDVATIKPAAPNGPRDIQFRWRANGQVEIAGATLQTLVSTAWDISGAMISDMPPWFSKTKWDITGKVNPDAFPKTRDGSPEVSFDDIELMLRALLKDRFALQAHSNVKPMDAYVLLPGNPKMKKADPAKRTYCDGRVPAGEKDPRAAIPIRTRLMVCQNVTMDQFAAQLQNYALDYIKTPVLNSTKLEGSYDLMLNWSTSRAARGFETASGAPITPAAPSPASGTGGDAPGQPSEPSGAISLPDAVAKQLGLRLEMQKRPVPILVIDHLEQNPTEN